MARAERRGRGGWSLLAVVVALAGCTSVPAPDAATSAPPSSPSALESSGPADPTATVVPPSPSAAGPADATVACDHLPLDPDGSSRSPLLTDLDAAATATLAQLQAAVVALEQESPRLVVDEARELAVSAAATGPVVVADVVLDRDEGGVTTLSVDMVLAMTAPDDQVVLRTLAVTDATRPARPTTFAATIDGQPVEVAIEPALDRVVLDVGGRGDGSGDRDDLVVRIAMEAEVPDAATALVPDRGPASYGLFSDQDAIVALGHWLPVPVAMPGNDGAVPPWGDLGAFAPASWVVDVDVPSGFVQTGGVDLRRAGPDGRPDGHGQVAVGLGLRDLAAVWTVADDACGPDRPLRSPNGPDVLTAWAAPTDDDVPGADLPGETAAVADLSTRQLAWLAEFLGPVPWPEHDVVRVDMDTAAGMEFPGLVMVDTDFWNARGEAGEYVLIHEWAHQYFHALVGNGSLSDPVVDEPLAQYLSWRWYLAQYGQAVADSVAANAIAPPDPPPLDPPGLSAGAFRDHANYSGAVYRVAADAWVTAADEHGVEVVDEIVQSLVDRYALGDGVTEVDVVAVANAVDPAVGADLAAAFSGTG